MRDTYLINGIETRVNSCEKSEYFAIRDGIKGRLLFKTKDEKELVKKLNELRGRGYDLVVS